MYTILLAERLAWTIVVPVGSRSVNTEEAVGVAGRGDDGRGQGGVDGARCHEAAIKNDGGDVGVVIMSPRFVSNARAVASERLVRCIESGAAA